ncbi:MAG: cadherin domain protein [Rhizobium sp.]|nr:cadherin domain protein [Rhizobium sp.]
MSKPTFSGASYQVNPDSPNDNQHSVAVATLADGRFVAVYANSGVDSGSIRYVIHNPDGTVAKAETVVNPKDEGFIDTGNIDVAALDGGGFAIVWASRESADRDIYHRVFDSSGTAVTGQMHTNADATDGLANRPDIVTDGNGGFYVVWDDSGYDRDPGPQQNFTNSVRMNQFGADGKPLTASTRISDDWGADSNASIAITRDGERINVVWDDDLGQSEDTNNTDGIYGTEYAGIGSYRVDGGEYSEFHTDPDVAYSTGNNFMAVWSEFISPGAYTIHGAVNAGVEFQINSSQHTLSETRPQVVGLQSGNFLVVWNDGGFGGNDDVLGQLFSASGERIDNEFQVSDRQSSYISRIEASEMLDGRVVVTWDAMDGPSEIFARVVDPRQAPSDWVGTRDEDYYVGTTFDDKLDGRIGDDTLEGGRGADQLIGGAGRDTASYAYASRGLTASLAGNGINTGDALGDAYSSIENLAGSRFADVLTGDDKANTLDGRGGNDIIDGGIGRDMLVAGLGTDSLTGDAGADRFIFAAGDTSKARDKADTISDFGTGAGDVIDLSVIDANDRKKGDQAFDFIGGDAFGDHAGELRVVRENSDSWVMGDIDGDGKADFTIHLDGNVNLGASHFDL